jgi:HemY protein
MIRLLTLLGVLAGIGFGAAWLADVPGQFRLEWQGWEVRAAPGLLVASLLVAAGLVLCGLLVIRFVWSLPRRAAAAWREQRVRRGWRSLESGLTAAAGGDERGVRSALKGVRVLPADAPLRLLLEAQAAMLVEDSAEAHAVFERMEHSGRTRLAALRGLVAEVRQQGRLEHALELAERAAGQVPSPRWALQECLDLSLRLHRWDRARRAVSALRRSGHMAEDAARRARGIIAVEVARACRADRNAAPAQRAASEAVSLLPEFAPAAAIAAEVWLDAGRSSEAARVIRTAWKTQPHPDLAFLLLRASGAEGPLAGVGPLEELTKLTPNTMEGHLALAEVALRAKLFGVARKYLDLVRGGHHDERVYRMLADLERLGGNDPEAASKWLSAALDAQPAPTWACGACAEGYLRWQAVCDRCGGFDRVAWGGENQVSPRAPIAQLQHLPLEPAALAGATP